MENDSTPVKDVKHSLFPCVFGIHRYEIYKEETVSSTIGVILSKIIISRCSVCGKIKTHNIRLTNTY